MVVASISLGCSTENSDDPGDPGTTEPPPGGSVNPGTGTNPGSSSTCNSVDTSGAPLVMDVMATGLPSLQGGSVSDGRYVLTKYEWFDQRATLHQRRIVMVISGGGSMGGYLWQRNQEPEERATVSITTSAEKIAMRGLCPSGSDLEWDRFAANGNSLVLFSTRDAKAATFTRQ
jgi:hypothetical protein